MDLSKLSNEDLEAISSGKMDKVSDAGLHAISSGSDPVYGQQDSPLDKVKKYAVGALSGAGKAEDSLMGAGTLVRPLAAMAGEAATGKKLFDMGELGDAYNPTNLKRFPDSDTLMARAGVPKGAKFSDIAQSTVAPAPLRAAAKMYAEPGSDHPWYQPEKGGMLDPTLRGAGGLAADIATDPATWISLGIPSVGKKAALEYAARLAAKPEMPLLEKVASAAKTAVNNPADAYWNMAQGVSQLPSKAVAKAGKTIYNSGMSAIDLAGEKLGKSDIGETLYQNGIHGGDRSIQEQANDLSDKIAGPNGTRTKLLADADNAGAQVDLGKALTPYVEMLDQAVKDGRLTAKEAQDHFEEFAGRFQGVETPNATVGTKIKGDSAERVGNLAYDPSKKNTLEQSLGQKATHGIKSEVENSVDDALGQGMGTETLAGQNDELSKLIAAKKVMAKRADDAAKRPFITYPDMMAAGAGLGIGHSPEYAGYGYAAKKLLDTLNSTGVKTSVGYAVRKLGENKVTGTAIDDLLRQIYKNKTNIDDQGGSK